MGGLLLLWNLRSHSDTSCEERTVFISHGMDDCGSGLVPELKDLETKLGRKVPESLARCLVGGKQHEKTSHSANGDPRGASSADLKRLESKMLFLKQEMVSLCCRYLIVFHPPVVHCVLFSSFYSHVRDHTS